MIWLTPFWVLAMVPTLERFTAHRTGLVISLVLLGVSVYSAESATRNPWSSSWLFQQMEQADWIDYSDPPPTFPFKRNLHTWFATLPYENADTAWIEFTAAGSSVRVGGTRSDTLRLYSLKRKMIEDDLVQTIKVVWNEGRSDERSSTFDLDVLAFEEGKEIAAQIPAARVVESEFSRFELLTLLRGIPADRAFRPATIRHVRTSVRNGRVPLSASGNSGIPQPEIDGATVPIPMRILADGRTSVWLCAIRRFRIRSCIRRDVQASPLHGLSVR